MSTSKFFKKRLKEKSHRKDPAPSENGADNFSPWGFDEQKIPSSAREIWAGEEQMPLAGN